jgi:hypothetical protein
VLSSQQFARRLAALDEPRASLRDKRNDRPLSRAEVEEWLRLFGLDGADDDDEGGP